MTLDLQPVPTPAPAAAAGGRDRTPWLRRTTVYRELVLLENGTAPARPALRATAAAVVRNPWVGTGADQDLAAAVEEIAPVLARELTDRLIDCLGGVDAIEAFGKAALVGSAGELEHAAALIHTP